MFKFYNRHRFFIKDDKNIVHVFLKKKNIKVDRETFMSIKHAFIGSIIDNEKNIKNDIKNDIKNKSN